MAYQTKTKVTEVKTKDFIERLTNATRKADALLLVKLMSKITGKRPKMWGPSIIGFDKCQYQYESGHQGEICMIGFSPRSTSQVFYMSHDFEDYDELLSKLGKYKAGKGCLYINKLADVDMKVLEALIHNAYASSKKKHSKKAKG